MKINFLGNKSFSLKGKNAKIIFDPTENISESDFDFATFSNAEEKFESENFKKIISLPGEFEISQILLTGFFSRPENIVYKAFFEDICFLHLGELEQLPDGKFFEKLGENIDVIFINLSDKCTKKLAKEIIDTIEPRMVFLGGDSSMFPKMEETFNAKKVENNFGISKANLSDEKTEILILDLA